MALDIFKQNRKSAKSQITRIVNWVKDKSDNETQVGVFESRIVVLKESFEKYCIAQDEIENLDPNDTEDRMEMEDKYHSYLCHINNFIKKLKPATVVTNNSGNSNVLSQKTMPLVKLPDISLSPFDGQVSNWKPFFELFTALIIDNPTLTDIQRLFYLKSSLKGEALNLIDTLEITNDNFKIAIDILKKRYENLTSTVNSHFHKILEIGSISKCTPFVLRSYISTLKKSCESLKKMNLDYKQLFEYFLINICVKKLDYGTKKVFENARDPDKIPTLDEFFETLEKRCIILENLSSSDTRLQDKPRKISLHSQNNLNLQDKYRFSNNTQKNTQNNLNSCIFCNTLGHKIYSCSKFSNISFNDKEKFVFSKKLCINCLGNKHFVQNCNSTHKCAVCKQKHHTLMHNNNKQSKFHYNYAQNESVSPNLRQLSQSVAQNIPQNSEYHAQSQRGSEPQSIPMENELQAHSSNTLVHSGMSTKNSQILLATARVTIFSRNGLPVNARILLDNGSQVSFVTQSLLNKIEYHSYTKNLDICGISQNSISSKSVVDICFYSRFDQDKKFAISCAVLEKITCKLPQVPIKVSELNIPKEIFPNLADPEFHEPSEIDMLVGADVFYNIICPDVHHLGDGLPTLLGTHLGWVIAGNLPAKTDGPPSTSFCVQNTDSQSVCLFAEAYELDDVLKKFWDLEEVGAKLDRNSSLSPEDQLAESIFSSTTQFLNGQYQVDMPFKSPQEYLKLGDSFKIAERRFLSLERRFKKDSVLFSAYKAFIDEYISLGHAKIVPLSLHNDKGENKYFIPHLCVIREASVTTKLRVVFDASCRTSTGISLNDVTLKGYQVQPELFDTVLRFRGDKYVLTCDIEKMYRNVKMNPKHTFLQNILWRDTPDKKFSCVELLTVTYGTNYAPFVATRVVKDAVQCLQETYPLGAEILSNRIYMDDILGGVDNFEDLKRLYSEINIILNSAGFKLHKWCSNSRVFLNHISHEQVLEYNLNLDNTPNKVLGLKWQPQKDVLTISHPQLSFDSPPTKRIILSTLAQCFDPLGLVNPVIVKGKILIQKLWLKKLDWDAVIEDEILLKSWCDFLKHISLLGTLKISRYLLLEKTLQKIEIHGFADASIAAYGACIYMRSFYDDGSVCCNLVTSKSKVAPIKSVSLPRLELCAMLVLSKLCYRVVKIFDSKFSFDSINLWTDSQIALFWCKDHASRWSIFVSNRVSQIQELTPHYKWRHIKSAHNPADVLSRGKLSEELIHSGFWFKGPKFLSDPNAILDNYSIPLSIVDPPEEKKVSCAVANIPSECIMWTDIFSRFSKFSKLQRTVAYIFRYVKNLRRPKEKLSGPLSVSELNSAMMFVVKTLQNLHFSQEISELRNGKKLSNKNLHSFNPFLDTNGFIRVGGRLANADIPYEQKHPLVLPSHNQIVRLMLKHEHKRLGHVGAQTVLSNFRQKFWPLNGLRETKRSVRECMHCFRFRALPANQIMANLPKDRVLESRPFQRVGIDFGGPFLIKSSRLRKAPSIKGYLALFVCMTTKAVHLELVTSLSTEAFLMTLKRFVSRRGNPSTIYSDNATNFVGAKNHLHDLYLFFQKNETSTIIREFLSQNETEWKFIPPRSPHWGGIWEAAIKSAKYHLNRLVGSTQLTYEELSTILCQIEAIMNSRPLYSLSNDPSDFQCLTPGHFLIGNSLTAYPDKNLIDVPENRLNFWKKCAQLQQTFWKKWSVDYLSRLQNRPKWLYSSKNLKVNDLVLLREDNVPALNWPMARVVEAHQGPDGKVRVVKLRTPHGYVLRSITKVSPLFNNE